MKAEINGQIEATVLRILEESDLEKVTEYMIREQASKELDLDLSQPNYKATVKQVVESFLGRMQEEKEENPLNETAEDHPEYDVQGNLIVCKLSPNRMVAIQKYKRMRLVSIREYHRSDDEEIPSSKGISLTGEQWSALKKNLPAIEKVVEKMESRNI